MTTHPVEKEEVMAYFDGELPAERAAAVRAHVEQCAECSLLARGLRTASERLASWQVDPAPARLEERMKAALEMASPTSRIPAPAKSTKTESFWTRPLIPRWVLGLAGGFAVLLLIVSISIPNLLRSRIASDRARDAANTLQVQVRPEFAPKDESGRDREGVTGTESTSTPSGPMIVRTASVTLVTKDFDNARTTIERIVREHQGYMGQLTVSGHAGAGRALTATLRVPSNRLDAAVAELKKLGRVEQETIGGEEVTQQYVDLVARLSNARNTEQRLIEVLRQRTGKVADVLAVEREIARVRGEIERMEAERKTLEKRVEFATVELRVTEEYKAQMEVAPPSTGTRLRNAVVEGYRSLVNSAVGLLIFLLSNGPTLLFWFAVLFWPARFAWRRLRALSL